MFNSNSTFLFVIAGLVILFVLAQSVFFWVRAWRRGVALGMERKKLSGAVKSTAVFTIAPAVSLLLGVVTLSKFLGIPLPWIRMSVIGAVTYELPAATAAANALGITELSQTITDPQVYSTIAWVMTLGILPSIILAPVLIKRIQKGMLKVQAKDNHWGELFMSALFLGMISSFLGMVFSDVRSGLKGFIPVFVLLFSAALMGICGLLIKKYKMKWLENYALPLSMIGAMIFAAFITPLIGGGV